MKKKTPTQAQNRKSDADTTRDLDHLIMRLKARQGCIEGFLGYLTSLYRHVMEAREIHRQHLEIMSRHYYTATDKEGEG